MSEPTNAPRSAEIHFKIRLNREQMPESIEWSATDASADDAKPTKSIMLSVWNDKEQKAMRIDLWTSAMLVDEMKLFTFQRASNSTSSASAWIASRKSLIY